MPARGQKKVAGRVKGTPNKTTVLMEKLVGGKLTTRSGPDSLEEMRQLAATMRSVAADLLARNMETIQGRQRLKDSADVRLLAEVLNKAQVAWERVAQYEWPKLSSIALSAAPLDLSKVDDDELLTIEAIVEKATIIGDDSGGEGSAPN